MFWVEFETSVMLSVICALVDKDDVLEAGSIFVLFSTVFIGYTETAVYYFVVYA